MSTTARLFIDELPETVTGARQVVIDCKHGTTRALLINPPVGFQLTDDDAVRTALVRHHVEEQCGCLKRLWRQYFGCEWPEIALARSGEP
jgi:hypothetical protein